MVAMDAKQSVVQVISICTTFIHAKFLLNFKLTMAQRVRMNIHKSQMKEANARWQEKNNNNLISAERGVHRSTVE